MPKLIIDYSNTIIYKIICKDKKITDLYVGHTTNFVQRKHSHKESCNSKSVNFKCKLYNVIRNNGGWDNWEMIMLEFFNCKNSIEAKAKEQEYYEKLQINKEVISSQKNDSLNLNEVEEKFFCKRCGYLTNTKCVFKSHLNRKTQCNPELSKQEVIILHPEFFSKEKNKEHTCEYCLKAFSSSSSKSYHKKTCPEKIQQNEKIKELEKKLEESEKKSKKSGKGKTINNNNNNNSNNTTINNNIIKLNVFGKENLDFLVNEPTFKKFMIDKY